MKVITLDFVYGYRSIGIYFLFVENILCVDLYFKRFIICPKSYKL